MLDSIVFILKAGINQALYTFKTVFDAVPGIWYFFLAFFVMVISYRALIRPIIGSAAGGLSRHENRGSSTLDSNGDTVYRRSGKYV